MAVKLTFVLVSMTGYVGVPRASGAGGEDFTLTTVNHQRRRMSVVVRDQASSHRSKATNVSAPAN